MTGTLGSMMIDFRGAISSQCVAPSPGSSLLMIQLVGINSFPARFSGIRKVFTFPDGVSSGVFHFVLVFAFVVSFGIVLLKSGRCYTFLQLFFSFEYNILYFYGFRPMIFAGLFVLAETAVQ